MEPRLLVLHSLTGLKHVSKITIAMCNTVQQEKPLLAAVGS
jgi:hypothetical protein